MSFIQDGKVSFIVDGQYGSTGKGNIAAYLASQPENRVSLAITNASANAGHWAKFKDGRQYLTHHLPMFGVIQKCQIYLCAGSIINPGVLLKEMKINGVDRDRVHIHPRAAIITPGHIGMERDTGSTATQIASTQQGVGTALAAKIMKKGNIAAKCEELKDMVRVLGVHRHLKGGGRAVMEIPQGFSLSIDQRFYPWCTSRNCTVAQGISDLGVHPSYLGNTVMSLRTYPIRVGHILDDNGKEIGNSGPVYPDQTEFSWDQLDLPEEKTTVTGRVRRIFNFSRYQLIDAVRCNRPGFVFLNFMNYLSNDQRKMNLSQLVSSTCKLETGVVPTMIHGHGPNIEDIRHEPI